MVVKTLIIQKYSSEMKIRNVKKLNYKKIMAKKKLSPIEQANYDAKKKAKAEKAASTHRIFDGILNSINVPPATHEHKFHAIRLWRFDYCWPDKKIALEVEGGVFTGGRHTSGPGFIGDMEKYNQAVLLGWRIIRTTPSELLKIGTANLIRELYNQ